MADAKILNKDGERIDIAVSELGASAVVRKINQLADSCQKLSPAMARSLRGKALRLGINTDKLVKDVAVAVLDKVVHSTPHDTGQARAHWIPAIRVSRPPTQIFEGRTDYDGDATVRDGTAIIMETPRPDGSVIYITNSLPYIKALNDGWSSQAAAGFVQMAVQRGKQVARNSKILKGG